MQRTNREVLLSILSKPHFISICFTLYILIRLAIILLVPINQFSDNLWYYNRAVALASGQGYTQEGIPTAYWPPGWPGLLGLLFWLFGPWPLIGQIANLGFVAITFVLALNLGFALFADHRVGRLTALILIPYPNQIGYVPILGSEVFYTALLLLAVFATIRGAGTARLILAGVLFGIATLTKTQALFIPAVLLAVWWLLGKERMRLPSILGKVAVVYATVAVVILPWTLRNYLVFGDFVLISTNGGATLLSGNNPTAAGDYTENDALFKRVPNDVAGQVANDRLATSMALKWIGNNPLGFLVLVPKKIWRLWAPDGEAEWAYQAGYKHYKDYSALFRTCRAVNQIYYLTLVILFILSIFYFVKQRRVVLPYAGAGYILVAYFTAISIVFSGQSRFHYPLMPWVAMYAAWTITQWANGREAGARSPVVAQG